jgi:class 3 adenylate cyclase
VPATSANDLHSGKLFQAHVIREADLFRGRHVSFQGNSFLVTFDGPARAVRAGIAINESARRLGIDLRTGVHTGECEWVDQLASGTAVELARLAASKSLPGEILASNTVKDLVVGSGLRFDSRTTVDLSDDLGELTLYRVVRK